MSSVGSLGGTRRALANRRSPDPHRRCGRIVGIRENLARTAAPRVRWAVLHRWILCTALVGAAVTSLSACSTTLSRPALPPLFCAPVSTRRGRNAPRRRGEGERSPGRCFSALPRVASAARSADGMAHRAAPGRWHQRVRRPYGSATWSARPAVRLDRVHLVRRARDADGMAPRRRREADLALGRDPRPASRSVPGCSMRRPGHGPPPGSLAYPAYGRLAAGGRICCGSTLPPAVKASCRSSCPLAVGRRTHGARSVP